MDPQLLQNIFPPDEAAMREAKEHWDALAKPVGSLGRLEELITRIAGIQGTASPQISRRSVIVLCADNGVLRQGVAMTPPGITALMAGFIADHRSAVCIMARQAGAEIVAVDMGMFSRISHPALVDRRIADGSGDISQGPAMSKEQAERAINIGIELVRARAEAGDQLIATGEMGIGNTTTSTAVTCALLETDPSGLTGRGVGLSDEGLQRKEAVIRQALLVNQPDSKDAVDVLAKVGGFDLAAMCGVFIGGAIYRIPILIDGLISSAAALCAQRICPLSSGFMLPSHASAEPAAAGLSQALGVQPLIHGELRLGEGTGAVAMMPLLDMALAVYNDLFTYADLENEG